MSIFSNLRHDGKTSSANGHDVDEFPTEDELLGYHQQYQDEIAQDEVEQIARADFPEKGVTNIRNEEWNRKHKSAAHKLLYMALMEGLSRCPRDVHI